MQSKHLPETSGAIETVPAASGTLTIDTGLRDMMSFSCSLAQDAGAAVAGVSWETIAQVPGGTQKVTLKTWEDDGTTAGSAAALVSWIALGN